MSGTREGKLKSLASKPEPTDDDVKLSAEDKYPFGKTFAVNIERRTRLNTDRWTNRV
jgi:hypothetical protein